MTNLFKRSRWLAAGAMLVASLHASTASLVLGGKNFTEQYVLTEITTQYLRAKGYTIDARTGLGTLIIRAIGQSNMMKLLVGAVLVSVLAIVADLLQALQRLPTPKGVQKT